MRASIDGARHDRAAVDHIVQVRGRDVEVVFGAEKYFARVVPAAVGIPGVGIGDDRVELARVVAERCAELAVCDDRSGHAAEAVRNLAIRSTRRFRQLVFDCVVHPVAAAMAACRNQVRRRAGEPCAERIHRHLRDRERRVLATKRQSSESSGVDADVRLAPEQQAALPGRARMGQEAALEREDGGQAAAQVFPTAQAPAGSAHDAAGLSRDRACRGAGLVHDADVHDAVEVDRGVPALCTGRYAHRAGDCRDADHVDCRSIH
nr:hypothetical protein [Burkholderia ubonensis]